MLVAQAHRGPEGMSLRRAGPAVFGACQLRFVDPDGPPQPYCPPEGTLLVTFNGEIYNHADLRAELAAAGREPPGRGEAALLAALYRSEGARMARRLNGMFAIALFDVLRGETVLIRDQLGKKPLSYALRGSDVRFSSELTGLRANAGDVDPAAIARYLTFNAIPAPLSLLRGVRKVEPGTIVRIREGTVRTERYWTPHLSPARLSRADSTESAESAVTVESALRVATRRRIPAGPLGVFLSGGLDSGLVAAMATGECPREIRSYSLGFPDSPSYDETGAARRMAAAVGTEHTVVPLTLAELAVAASGTLGRLDEPIADHSLVPTAVLAAAARADVKAVLTGDGADELGMGYALFAASRALRGLTRVVPPLLVRAALGGVGRSRPGERNLHPVHVAALLARVVSTPPERQYYAAAAAVPPADQPALLTPEAADAARHPDDTDPIEEFMRANPDATPSERLQLGMICHFLRDVILGKLDRATMLASVEARSPFLDAEVVDLMLGLPPQQRLRRFTGKYVIRQVAARYLPRELVQQRKRGFRAPVAALLRGPLRDWVTDLLAPSTLRAGGLLRPDAVRTLLNEHLAGTADHHRPLWSLACLQSTLDATARAPRTSELGRVS